MTTSAQEPNEQPEPFPGFHEAGKRAEEAIAKPKKPKKAKPPTRGERFVDAAQTLMDAIGDLQSAWEEYMDPIRGAIEELKGIQEEYQNWYDNMPESLQQGATGEKLETICNIQLDEIDEPDFYSLESAAQECLDADQPLGFGRD